MTRSPGPWAIPTIASAWCVGWYTLSASETWAWSGSGSGSGRERLFAPFQEPRIGRRVNRRRRSRDRSPQLSVSPGTPSTTRSVSTSGRLDASILPLFSFSTRL